jgi:hypothetical protein
MKEQTLMKMKYDLELTQKAVVVALNRIEKLEEKANDNRGKNTEDTGVQNLDSEKES